MKRTIFAFAILICGTAMAQEKPTEVKKETAVKKVKFKDEGETKEGKIKVVSTETSNVKLDSTDTNKINQDRVAARKKVTTTVMIDNDTDSAYDILSTETYYINADKSYKFSPDESGFMMALGNDKNEFVEIGKAWNSKKSGSYVIKGKTYSGIGYFDKNGNFIVEYYDEDSESIKTETFEEKKDAM